MRFSEWLDRRGKGLKTTSTGLNAGGQSQYGMRFNRPVRPHSPASKSKKKPGLWANINKIKKLGISRPKSKSTISAKAYANMKKGFPKKGKKK